MISGGICALANALPAEVASLQALYEQSKMKEAVDLQHRLVKPNSIGIKLKLKICDFLHTLPT